VTSIHLSTTVLVMYSSELPSSAMEWKKRYLQIEGKLKHFRIKAANIKLKLSQEVRGLFPNHACFWIYCAFIWCVKAVNACGLLWHTNRSAHLFIYCCVSDWQWCC